MNKLTFDEDGILIQVSWDTIAEAIELLQEMLADEEFIAGITKGVMELIEANS